MILSSSDMGRHSEWRKIAKKERRRRIRTEQAKERDRLLNESEDWVQQQELLEVLEYEQIEECNREENEKWLQAEKIAMEQWQKLLEIRERLRQERLEQEAKMKQEYELEQKRKKMEEERLKEIEEENMRKQQLLMEKLEKFLSGDADDPPPELQILRETKPDAEPCPFFTKTACCRFGDKCSRNHQYPGISKTLLATNFYLHFGWENAGVSEYDTDIMLEYDDGDTYREFRDFFHDVLPEFEKFGRIVQFKVCKNYEKHLRGNTYVQFAEVRSAVAAFRALHSRWYGGRQLSLQFCTIHSWKNALCGLQSGARCPKGRSCNFLHVFRNPENLFCEHSARRQLDSARRRRTSPDSWRWSESPERDIVPRVKERESQRRREKEHKRRRDRSRTRR